MKVGYFVSVEEGVVTDPNADVPSEPNDTPPLIDVPDLHFAFKADGRIFFKSKFCEELDGGVGDLLVRLVFS